MLTDKTDFTIVQITDMHLFAEESKELLGFCTHKHLVETVNHILANSSIEPDAIFVTGDISQDETAQSYKLAATQFDRFGCPVYWIHGNHDDERELQPVFENSRLLKKLTALSTPFWDFITLDTCRRGTDKGYIEDSEYEILASRIKASSEKNKKIAIVMHHHPEPVNTPLIDEYILDGHEKFLSIAQQNADIKLVICGHVHGDYKIPHDGFIIETCPATCFQWKKGTGKVEAENKRGYKIFNFNPASYTVSTVFI